MSQNITKWIRLGAVGSVLLLGACAQTMQPQPPPMPPVAANPPPVPPGPNATWFHIGFDSNKFALNAEGQKVVADVKAFLASNPDSIATIIGKTDSVGSKDYNMRLSHRRADAVRDALVYGGNVPADRVETRWTGESRQRVATNDGTDAAANRVVDIAVH